MSGLESVPVPLNRTIVGWKPGMNAITRLPPGAPLNRTIVGWKPGLVVLDVDPRSGGFKSHHSGMETTEPPEHPPAGPIL